jgi:hypothetical protein
MRYVQRAFTATLSLIGTVSPASARGAGGSGKAS